MILLIIPQQTMAVFSVIHTFVEVTIKETSAACHLFCFDTVSIGHLSRMKLHLLAKTSVIGCLVQRKLIDQITTMNFLLDPSRHSHR